MEQIEYTRTVVPSSMRSPYWKYFGFPSDNGNNILTRQKIVCTICNTAIAYNKNTSNLRTHLMAKHIEIFQKIIKSSNTIKNIKEQKHCDYISEICDSENLYTIPNATDIKRRRTISQDKVTLPIQSKSHFDAQFLTIPDYLQSETIVRRENTELNSNKVELQMQSANYIGLISTNESEIVEETEHSVEHISVNTHAGDTKNEETFAYTDLILSDQNDEQMQSMDIMLADMIQVDLCSLDILQNYGFCKYNQQLTGLKMDNLTVERIKNLIEKRYIHNKAMITSHVMTLSQNQPYSLSMEVYADNDGQNILNIYYNYLNENQMDLVSILYTTSTIGYKSINISEHLIGMNIKNCGGVVVHCEDEINDFVLEFTECHELPLIECLESILTRCLQKIFEINTFREYYDKLLKLMVKNTNHTRKAIPRPRCHWSKFKVLEYIIENMLMEENKFEQWSEMKRIFEYIKPLKMALDIITDEYLPLCTLTRPLIIKLFEEHFSTVNKDEDEIIFNIQKILKKELYEKIMTQSFLNEATFFDTRFHREFSLHESVFDISNFKSKVLKRFKDILEVICISKPYNLKAVQNHADSFTNRRKCSSIKSFFKRDNSMTLNNDVNIKLKTNLDLEVEQLLNEASLDLDQSPALWWQLQSVKYKELSKIAKHYLTIPCCCLPRLTHLDVEQKLFKLDRRKNLSQLCSTESTLWYMYYNNSVIEMI